MLWIAAAVEVVQVVLERGQHHFLDHLVLVSPLDLVGKVVHLLL
jgi:hypothetical protein